MTPPTREMTERDRPFVAATWARSSRYGFASPRDARLPFRIVDALLQRSPRVLCVASDERTVHAWAAGHGDVLHFVYTAPELRRQGLARFLLREMFGAKGPGLLTHDAPRRLAPRAYLNPYLIAGIFCGDRKDVAA